MTRYEKAVEYYEQDLAIRRELKDRSGEASALQLLGSACSHLKQTQRSSAYYQQALAILRELKDRIGEADTFSSLASAYSDSGEPDKAIGYYEQALAIFREKKYEVREASTLWNIALIYEHSHDQQKAISHYEQILAIPRKALNRTWEILALTGLGRVYVWTDNEKANSYFEQVLALQHKIRDRRGEAKTLNILGVIQAKLSRYDKELGYYERALAIAREGKDRSGEGISLYTLGGTYMRLHQHEKAMKYFESALTIFQELKDRGMESDVLWAMGVAYTMVNRFDTARIHVEQALALAREAKDGERERRALIMAGGIYGALHQREKAIACIEQGLAMTREAKDGPGEVLALICLSGHYIGLKQGEKATGYLEKALAMVHEMKFREPEADILGMLMEAWAQRSQPRLAIVFGKKSINMLQEIRNDLVDLDQTLRQAFLQGKKSRYRALAELLAAQGRLGEAQQVIGLLKEDEFTNFVLRDRNVSAKGGRVTLNPQEADWEKRYRDVADRLTSIGVRRGALLAKAERSAADEKEISTLEADLEAGNRAFQAFLNTVEATTGSDKSASDQMARVREAEGLMETLRALGPGAVAVYTIVGEQGYRSILITPDVQKSYSYSISAAALNKKILAFRELVRNPNSDPRPLARELYDILVKPMEKDLDGAQAKIIMWSLDGALRYMPMAALYDGERYLVERFCNVVFTAASQSRLKDPVSHDWRGLGLGVSLAHEGFQPLPNVPNELSGIIQSGPKPLQGILPGTVKLDGDFTKDGFRAELRKHYSIVHVASHFDFAPGTDRNSYLLLGDGGKLTLEEFRSMPQVLQGVELLTLSACDTAVGGEDADGKEVEGFAVLAQRQGAKAVVATLWAVADESTALLMKEFYRLHTAAPNITKAEALRQAQLALLTGKIQGDTSGDRGPRTNRDGEAAKFVKDPQRPYAHPYFWAPFLLMGNWK